MREERERRVRQWPKPDTSIVYSEVANGGVRLTKEMAKKWCKMIYLHSPSNVIHKKF